MVLLDFNACYFFLFAVIRWAYGQNAWCGRLASSQNGLLSEGNLVAQVTLYNPSGTFIKPPNIPKNKCNDRGLCFALQYPSSSPPHLSLSLSFLCVWNSAYFKKSDVAKGLKYVHHVSYSYWINPYLWPYNFISTEQVVYINIWYLSDIQVVLD